MAWFLNYYECECCEEAWTDEWSCMCDDECPHCGARNITPVDSEDLTALVTQHGRDFVAFRSPNSAEYDPDYRSIGRFSTRTEAEAFLAAIDDQSNASLV